MKIYKIMHNVSSRISTALQREVMPQGERTLSVQTIANHWKLQDFLKQPIKDFPQLIIKHLKKRKADMDFSRYLRKYQ